MDDAYLIEYLVYHGLPEVKKDHVKIDAKGKVHIKDLDKAECDSLMDIFHGKVHFDIKMFCNRFTPLTPEKIPPPAITISDSSLVNTSEKVTKSDSFSTSQKKVSISQQMVSIPAKLQISTAENPTQQAVNVEQADKGKTNALSPSFQAAKAHWLKMDEFSFSDFKSCDDSQVSSDHGESDVDIGDFIQNKSLNEKKREKRNKRKSRQSPDKNEFILKKVNLQDSPK